jgi:hypothetical protein
VELSTNQKGAIAESAVAHTAIKLGLGVFRPLSDGERCDPILDLRPRLLRVQCKTAVRHGAVLAVPFHSSRRRSAGFVKRIYTRDEIDAVAAYSQERDRCFLLPMSEFGASTYVQLRLAPSWNHQRAGINWADDYDFAVTLKTFGAVAQLGERRAGSAKVRGSSPLGSIHVRSAESNGATVGVRASTRSPALTLTKLRRRRS